MDRVELDEMKAMFIKERKTKGITIAMPEKLHNEIKIKAMCNSDFEDENDVPVEMRLNRFKFWKKVLCAPKGAFFKDEALSKAIGYTKEYYTDIRY